MRAAELAANQRRYRRRRIRVRAAELAAATLIKMHPFAGTQIIGKTEVQQLHPEPGSAHAEKSGSRTLGDTICVWREKLKQLALPSPGADGGCVELGASWWAVGKEHAFH